MSVDDNVISYKKYFSGTERGEEEVELRAIDLSAEVYLARQF